MSIDPYTLMQLGVSLYIYLNNTLSNTNVFVGQGIHFDYLYSVLEVDTESGMDTHPDLIPGTYM